MATPQEHYELAEEFSRLAAAEAAAENYKRAKYYTQQAIVHAELSHQ